MKNIQTPRGIYQNKAEFENLIEYEEYYLIKENIVYKMIIGKKEDEVIIKCKNYKINININDLSIMIKKELKTIDEAYQFIINSFEYNKVIISEITIHEEIKISIKTNINYKEKDIAFILTYNKDNKNFNINVLYDNYNKLKIELNNLKEEINILKKEKNNLNINNNINIIKKEDEEKIKDTMFKSSPKEIQFIEDLAKDSYIGYSFDNSFIVFKAINRILYLIYSNKNTSIISYDIINNKKIKEIKNAHNDYITNFRYYLDEINKRDLFLSLSYVSKDLKLWDFNKWNCLFHINNIYTKSDLTSACFLNDNNQIYIIPSNNSFELIKVFDINGNKIKEINDSKNITYFIDSYYDDKLSKNFIITGNKGYILSYDYNKNKIYNKYIDNNTERDIFSIIINNNENIIKIIESSNDANIRIWNFHSKELLNKIKVDTVRAYGICLWNKNYLFVGCYENMIKLVDLNNGVMVKNLEGHQGAIFTVKKIIHPKYDECLITQGYGKDGIKLWANKNI